MRVVELMCRFWVMVEGVCMAGMVLFWCQVDRVGLSFMELFMVAD